MWSLREAILFVGGVREREEKIIEERERRNAIYYAARPVMLNLDPRKIRSPRNRIFNKIWTHPSII